MTLLLTDQNFTSSFFDPAGASLHIGHALAPVGGRSYGHLRYPGRNAPLTLWCADPSLFTQPKSAIRHFYRMQHCKSVGDQITPSRLTVG